MKIGIVSDLHLEFHKDGGGALVSTLFRDVTLDVLVVAGDLTFGHNRRAKGALKLLCERFREASVVYVPGNHEHYYSDFDLVRIQCEDAARRLPNLCYLDRGVTEIGGRRFVGATLWFEKNDVRDRVNDFKFIRGFEPRVYEECRLSKAFLQKEVRESDIVVTHHLPSWRSIASKYRGAASNAFFVCDVEPIMRENRPALWIHGHTHTACDYEVGTARGSTRIVCNPLGYPGETGSGFDPCKVVEI